MENLDNLFWDIIDNEFGETPYGDPMPIMPPMQIIKPLPNIIIMITGEIGRAHVELSHTVISYAVFCLKKKTKKNKKKKI